MSRGKAFEREVLRSFSSKYPDLFHLRIGDKMHQKTPADLITSTPTGMHLIECKARKAKSIPFNALAPHQNDELVKYNQTGHGWVAVQFYGHRWRRAWLIPIQYWNDLELRHPLKSINCKVLERELPEFEMVWVGKRQHYELPQCIDNPKRRYK